MNIEICGTSYQIKTSDKNINNNLLFTLFHIKSTINSSLTFKSGCKSGVCGSCAVRVNGIEKLACKTNISDGDVVTPLNNLKPIKDLVVDQNNKTKSLQTSKAYLEEPNTKEICNDDIKKIDIESNCILCNSCVSACPVYSINQNFIAPFALVRNYRYIEDKREDEIETKIKSIQENGIWDCTLCGNCNMVCPSHIDIKGDIEKLRNKSAQFGYNTPNMNTSFDTGFDFLNQNSSSCGFNPNQF